MMPDPLQSHRFHAILVIARKGGNTMDEKMREDFPGRTEQVQTMKCDPLDLITTDQLETELWNAIMEDSSGSCTSRRPAGGAWSELGVKWLPPLT